ncbi:MAG: hypothetical protein JNM74_12595 [Myxococcales bacterium]|nr:hypothetical protein [Myxococcales bacterium]
MTRLADDVRRIVDRTSALALAGDDNEAKVTVAALVLAEMPEAHRELGLDRVRALARSSSLVLRGFALMILAHADVERDEVVAAWVAVAEGDFADVCVRARDVLRGLSCATADAFPLVMRLVDSTTPAVRALGIEKLTASEGIFATDRTLVMLAEHPDRDVRAYAVHLAAEHLREGLVPLLGIEALVRATLGESLPDARAKRTLLELLGERATRDEGQAEVIARWLSPYARTRTVRDRVRIVSVLARIEASFPGVVTPLSVTR